MRVLCWRKNIVMFLAAIGVAIALGAGDVSMVVAESSDTNVTQHNSRIIMTPDQTFYVYVDYVGEMISYGFTPVLRTNSHSFYRTEIIWTTPGGTEQVLCNMSANTIENNLGNNSLCTGTITAAQVGTYKLAIDTAASPGDEGGYNQTAENWRWRIEPSGGNGKVWMDSIAANHASPDAPPTPTVDMTHWMVRADGYLYKVTNYGFNGVSWSLRSDAIGIVASDSDCVSAYTSYATSTAQGELFNSTNHKIADASCGGRAKIFFTEPSAKLPPKDPATNEWIKPYNSETYKIPLLPNINISYTHGGEANYAGTFHIRVRNYIGQVIWQPIIDGVLYGSPIAFDSSLDDDLDTSYDVAFDGKYPGTNNFIPLDKKVTIRATAYHPGEMHIVAGDVEIRGGISVQRLTTTTGNMNQPASGTIFWNDTNLVNQRCGNRWPDLSGTNRTVNGVNSLVSGGTHGWNASGGGGFSACSDPYYGNDNCATLSSCARGSSWGDVRQIEDWTYDTSIDIEKEFPPVALDLRPNLQITKSISNATPRVGHEYSYNLNVQNQYVDNEKSPGIMPTYGQWVVTDTIDSRIAVVGTPTIKIGNVPIGSCATTSQSNGSTLVTCTSDTTLYPSNSDMFNVAVINIAVKPSLAAADEVISNIAYVGGGNDTECTEPKESNPARCRDSVDVTPSMPRLEIKKDLVADTLDLPSDPATNIVRVNYPHTYKLTVTNIGSASTVGDYVITDTLDSNLVDISFPEAQKSEVDCSYIQQTGTVACESSKVLEPKNAGSKLEVYFTARAYSPKENMRNVASVGGGEDYSCPYSGDSAAPPSCSSNEVVVNARTPELHVNKILNDELGSGTQTLVVGEASEYTIVVHNAGKLPTRGSIYIQDTIPQEFVVDRAALEASYPNCELADDGHTLTCYRDEAIEPRTLSYDPNNLFDSSQYWVVKVNVVPSSVKDDIENVAYVYGGDDYGSGDLSCKDLDSVKNSSIMRCQGSVRNNSRHAALAINKTAVKADAQTVDDDTQDDEGDVAGGEDASLGDEDANLLTSVVVGEIFDYNLTVKNVGNHKTTKESYVIDFLPNNVSLLEETLPDDCRIDEDYDRSSNLLASQASSIIICTVPADLAVYSSGTDNSIEFTFSVKSIAVGETISNTAFVFGDDLDCPAESSAFATARCAAMHELGSLVPLLYVTKDSSVDSIEQHNSLRYIITATNIGNTPTTSVALINDLIPDNFRLISAEPIRNDGKSAEDVDGRTCNIDTNRRRVECVILAGLEPSKAVSFAVTVEAIIPASDINNIATIFGGGDPTCQLSEEDRIITTNPAYNDPSRCQDNTLVSINALKPPLAGTLRLIIGAVATIALLGFAVWLIMGKNSAKQHLSVRNRT